MTTAKELYRQIINIENQAAHRDLSNDELWSIMKLQDLIEDMDHPGYEMKEIFTNDTLTFFVFSKKDGSAVDNLSFEQRSNQWSNQYFVRGHWQDFDAAKAQAYQFLDKWF